MDLEAVDTASRTSPAGLHRSRVSGGRAARRSRPASRCSGALYSASLSFGSAPGGIARLNCRRRRCSRARRGAPAPPAGCPRAPCRSAPSICSVRSVASIARSHRAGLCGLLGREIAQFTRIVLEVVELWPRREDEFPPAVAHRAQIAPAVVQQRHERFGERRLVVHRHPLQRVRQAAARRARRSRAPGQLENRPSADRSSAPRFRAACRASRRPADHERHPQRRLVDEIAVHVFAVLAQRLAVIGRDNHQCAIERAALAQGADQTADELVGPGDRPVVRPAGVLRRVGFRRQVGRVRIVEVDPGKESVGLPAAATRSLPRRRGPRACDRRSARNDRSSGRKPRARPDCRSRTGEAMKAPVAKPSRRKISARTGTWSASGGETLSRMPCSAGYRPVNSETCDGRVSGACTVACGAQAPSRARRSMFGVATFARHTRRADPRGACRS